MLSLLATTCIRRLAPTQSLPLLVVVNLKGSNISSCSWLHYSIEIHARVPSALLKGSFNTWVISQVCFFITLKRKICMPKFFLRVRRLHFPCAIPSWEGLNAHYGSTCICVNDCIYLFQHSKHVVSSTRSPLYFLTNRSSISTTIIHVEYATWWMWVLFKLWQSLINTEGT